MSFHDPKPVERCACGAECEWCIGANLARVAFPRAKVPPHHDADTEHECHRCFLARPDLVVTECTKADGEEPW